jgi:nucleoside-triphosphatase
MGKAYLLTGDKGVGKTTALKAIINVLGAKQCGGFYAQEERINGIRTGFHIITLDERNGILADVKSKSQIRVGGLNEEGVGKYGVDLEFLENVGLQIIYESIASNDVSFIIIDEIGPMQLFSSKFKQAVMDVMKSSKILVGTIVLRSHPWTDEFKQRKDVETFLLTTNNRENMTKMLSWLLNKIG